MTPRPRLLVSGLLTVRAVPFAAGVGLAATIAVGILLAAGRSGSIGS